jgi:cytochrome P450
VLIWRRVTSPTTLGGFEIPVGTEILLSPFITHRDPAIYSEPTRFQPERWSSIRPSPFEYLPFSYGARKCLGAAFAEILIKVTIAMLVQRYRLELVPGCRVKLNVTFTIKPRPALPMRVRRQDRQFRRSPAVLRSPLMDLVSGPLR